MSRYKNVYYLNNIWKINDIEIPINYKEYMKKGIIEKYEYFEKLSQTPNLNHWDATSCTNFFSFHKTKPPPIITVPNFVFTSKDIEIENFYNKSCFCLLKIRNNNNYNYSLTDYQYPVTMFDFNIILDKTTIVKKIIKNDLIFSFSPAGNLGLINYELIPYKLSLLGMIDDNGDLCRF